MCRHQLVLAPACQRHRLATAVNATEQREKSAPDQDQEQGLREGGREGGWGSGALFHRHRLRRFCSRQPSQLRDHLTSATPISQYHALAAPDLSDHHAHDSETCQQ